MIYEPWNNIDVSCCYSDDVIDNVDNLNPDLILPIPRIPTSSPSPPGSPSPAQPASDSQLVDPAYNVPVRDLKRPRAPVAADLDTANILPSQHRRKQMKRLV